MTLTCDATSVVIENETKRTKITKRLCRVLAVFTKSYNKWIMTEDKQRWSPDMKETELKKYRCSVRMITDDSVEEYEDVDLNTNTFELKTIAKIISGVDIISVHNSLFTY